MVRIHCVYRMIGSWQEEGIPSIIMRGRKENTAIDTGGLEIELRKVRKLLADGIYLSCEP